MRGLNSHFGLARLFAVLAIIAFVAMVAVGEKEIRTSPKWPPPVHHALGAWEIDDPPILLWATGINLPASIPILLLGANDDGFMYALDDHQLIVYLPWLVLVVLLWYFVAYRIESIFKPRPLPPRQRYAVLLVQAFITLEISYVAALFVAATTGVIVVPPAGESYFVGTGRLRPGPGFTTEAAFVCAWMLLVLLGWLGLVRENGVKWTRSLRQDVRVRKSVTGPLQFYRAEGDFHRWAGDLNRFFQIDVTVPRCFVAMKVADRHIVNNDGTLGFHRPAR